MTGIPTTTGHDGTEIPRVGCLTGWRYGTPPVCAGCGQEIDPGDDYLVMWSGTAERPRISAAAHHGRWTGTGNDDYDTTCPDALRRGWELAPQPCVSAGCAWATTVAVPLLRRPPSPSRRRQPAGARRPGVWLAGRFENTVALPRPGCTSIWPVSLPSPPLSSSATDVIVQHQPQAR